MLRMNIRKRVFSLFILSITLTTTTAGTIKYAGARSSIYGIDPFPSTTDWKNILYNVSDNFTGATPSAVWIMGTITNNGECYMEFPSDKSYNNIIFYKQKDRHEEFLSYFDKIGVKIFVQVEAGMADPIDCMDAIFEHYGNHSCFAGFGVDVEWYPSTGETNASTPVTNTQIKAWSDHLKTFNSSYRLFVKHWETGMLGTSPVDDVIYIDDSQDVQNLDALMYDFYDWSDTFYPNMVGFQVGYPNDKKWWSNLNDPVADIASVIEDNTGSDQEVAYFWVDFSLDDPMLDLYAENNTVAINNNLKKLPTAKNKIFVNKVGNSLKFSISNRDIQKGAHVEIISLSGQEIRSEILGKRGLLNNFNSKGIFIVNITSGNSTVTGRFVNLK